MSILDDIKNKNAGKAADAPTKPELVKEISKTVVLPPEARVALHNPPKTGQFIYSCPHAEAFSIHLGGGEVRAKDGLMYLDQKQHDELQALIKSGRPDIAQNAVLLDKDAAEKIALEYLAKHKAEAARGASHSNANAERMDFREVKPTEAPPGSSAASANTQGGRPVIERRTIVPIEESAIHAEDAKVEEGSSAQ